MTQNGPGEAIRAILIFGAARTINILLVVIRAKLIASLLGPAGIGLLGLLSAVQEVGAQTSDAGASHAAVRQIAREADAPDRMRALRAALMWLAIAGGLTGAAVLFALRSQIADLLLGDTTQQDAFGILAVGLFLLVIFRWQQSLLSGYRRARSLAVMVVLATALGTLAGAAAVWSLGTDGLVWAVVAMPAAGVCVALFFTRKLPRPVVSGSSLRTALTGVLRLGPGLMAIALLALLSPLAVRVWLTWDIGLDAAG
ncbi:MAG: oligosaccharide flippase family protein, partial [Pseudomonadota bacterium]